MRQSLRLKLNAVFLVLALGLSVMFIGGMQRAIGAGWRLAGAPLVSDYVDRLVTEIGTPPSIDRARALTQFLPISVRIQGPRVRWSSHPAKADRGWLHDGDWHGDSPQMLERDTVDGHDMSLGLGELPWDRQPRLVGWFTLLVPLTFIALAYADVSRLLRTLDDIRSGVRRFGKGEFDQAIMARRQDELGELARHINTMADDLRQMIDGKRALLLAISHDLRSPLTRARLHAELLPEIGDGGARRAALLRDLGEMRDMINDLLETERLSGSHVALHREPTDLCALVTDRVPLAQMEHDLPTDLRPVDVDAARVRLAVRKLLDNAVRHGAGQLPAQVSVRRAGQAIVVTVRDHGPGVDPAQLAQLGQALYRTDAARQRVTGGVGLGLYLARLVARAHGAAA